MSSNAGDGSTEAAEAGSRAIDYSHLAEVALQEWEAAAPATVAFDTETSGVAFYDAPFCVTLAWDQDDGDYRGHYLELAEPRGFEVAREILLGTTEWVFHNAKFDIQKFILAGLVERADVDEHIVQDTEALAHLLDPNARKGLKPLAVDWLGWDDTITVEKKNGQGTYEVSAEKYALDEARRKLKLTKDDGYHVLPREVLIPYAVADAVMTIQLFDKLMPRLQVRDTALQYLYHREMQLALVLLDIEAAGMRVDMNYVNATIKKLTGFMYQQEKNILRQSGRDEFKDHHIWIKEVLTELGIEVKNVQAATLETIEHPIVAAILEWRRLKKLYDYFNAIRTEQRDNILHPSFRQHGTKTGRMSSGKVVE